MTSSPTPRLCDMKVLSPGGFVRLAWAEWGSEEATRVAVCCHGLTRNGRDFDALAHALAAAGWRVIAPDVPGRGRSEWLLRASDYTYPFYCSAMAALIGRVGAESVDWVGTPMGELIGMHRRGVETVDWIGTSMGGLIGMMLAAQPGTPIRRLVLNDIGAFVPKAALERLAEYVGQDPRFADAGAVEAYLRRVHAPFGRLSDAEWRHLAAHGAIPAEGAQLRLHYDPAIGKAFTAKPPEDVVLWPVWEAVACPTLLVRGAESDLFPAETAAEMTRRGAAGAAGRVELREVADAGHAPALMATDQVAMVRDFLARP